MIITYKQATIQDVDLLVNSRIDLLKAANHLENNESLDLVAKQLRNYYTLSIPSGNYIAYLAYHEDIWVGTGGICFYTVAPTYHNPTGKKAYITNMYTKPDFRKNGIATYILNMLIKTSLDMGINFISLEATASGRTLYEKHGFVTLHTEMQLNNEAYDVTQNEEAIISMHNN